MKLKALGRYVSEKLGIAVKKGMIIEVDEKLGAALQADCPEGFEVVPEALEPEPKVTKRVSKV